MWLRPNTGCSAAAEDIRFVNGGPLNVLTNKEASNATSVQETEALSYMTLSIRCLDISRALIVWVAGVPALVHGEYKALRLIDSEAYSPMYFLERHGGITKSRVRVGDAERMEVEIGITRARYCQVGHEGRIAGLPPTESISGVIRIAE